MWKGQGTFDVFRRSPGSVFAQHYMPAIDLDRGDHAVEVDGEACHAAFADRGVQLVIDLFQFFFQGRDVNIVRMMVFKNLQDLALDIGVRGAAQGDPDCVVPVFDRQRREILEKLRKLAVVIIADIQNPERS